MGVQARAVPTRQPARTRRRPCRWPVLTPLIEMTTLVMGRSRLERAPTSHSAFALVCLLTRRAPVRGGASFEPFARDRPIARNARSIGTKCNTPERCLDFAVTSSVARDFRKTHVHQR